MTKFIKTLEQKNTPLDQSPCFLITKVANEVILFFEKLLFEERSAKGLNVNYPFTVLF
jgi:hypothetical protein